MCKFCSIHELVTGKILYSTLKEMSDVYWKTECTNGNEQNIYRKWNSNLHPCSNHQLRKPNKNLCSICSQMVRTLPITSSFSNFCHFQSSTTRKSQTCFPNWLHSIPHLLTRLQFLHANDLQSGPSWWLPLFTWRFCPPLPASESVPNKSDAD